MEYTIDHQTTYYYADSVDESYTVVHLQPRSDQHQFCTRYALELAPKVRFQAYADRYGNDVQHFAILPRHASLSITAHSSVVTMREHEPAEPTEATRALLESDAHVPRYYDYVHESEYVQFTPELDAFAAEFEPPGERIGVWCASVSHRIHESFAYDTDATTVRTTVVDALRAKAGVCQDSRTS